MESILPEQTEKSHQMDAWLDIAEAMLGCGAEVRRVEKALGRLSASGGATGINAFTLNSYISITCVFADGAILTQSRRIVSDPSTDLELLEQLNTLSREACASHMPAEQLKEKVRKLSLRKKDFRFLAGGFAAAFGFALFFGSGPAEALVSGIGGLLLCLLMARTSFYFPNAVFSNFFYAFLCGLAVYCLCRLLPGLNPDRILIGDIMLLIPGLTITNSIRDIMIGDTISGTMRFVESLLWAGALAIGFVAAMLLAGGAR